MSEMLKFNSKRERIPLYATVAIVAAAVVALHGLGRVWWCTVGDWAPWSWTVNSAHNSQHILDPYSFTHVLHGILEFWLIGLIFYKLPLAWRFVIAIFIESAWEVGENTSYVINRYREATISLDYFGDSIINSLADIVFCAVGFLIAWKLRFWRSFVLFIVTEIVLIVTIRDSLLINIVMLVYPIEAIKTWQSAL